MKFALDFKNTLIVTIACLLIIAANLKWQDSLRETLNGKKDELREFALLLSSKEELAKRESEIASFTSAMSAASEAWKDDLPNMVADQKLILRQVRPLGIEQRGKINEERVFLQVEGDIRSLSGFLHALASSEMPIYASQVSINSQTFGQGFLSGELVLAKPVVKK